MNNKNIYLQDENGANNLDAYNLKGAVCISVFDFECELSKDSTEQLRDFLNAVLDDNTKTARE